MGMTRWLARGTALIHATAAMDAHCSDTAARPPACTRPERGGARLCAVGGELAIAAGGLLRLRRVLQLVQDACLLQPVVQPRHGVHKALAR